MKANRAWDGKTDRCPGSWQRGTVARSGKVRCPVCRRELPSIRTPGGQVITRWTLSQEERRAVIMGEDIYVTILSVGGICPLFVTVGPVDWRANE